MWKPATDGMLALSRRFSRRSVPYCAVLDAVPTALPQRFTHGVASVTVLDTAHPGDDRALRKWLMDNRPLFPAVYLARQRAMAASTTSRVDMLHTL